MDFTVTLVGAGNMGGAMLKGWIANGMEPSSLRVVDPSPSDQMKTYLGQSGIALYSAVDTGMADTDVLLVAVKPQMMATVLPKLSGCVGSETVIVSVAAGTMIETLAQPFGNPAVIRVMPNTPSLIGRGMAVACPSSNVTEKQRANVTQLMQAIGRIEWVEDEAQIDVVTAVSGSGPAYVFHLVECMANAGIEQGLPADLAYTLARETVSGAGELIHQSDLDASVLRINVTSPGGTTAAALEVLMSQENGMPSLFKRAIAAARKRSEELSQE